MSKNNSKERTVVSKPTAKTANPTKNPPAPESAEAPAAVEAKGNGKPETEHHKKEKRAKIRLVSTTIPGLWVRAFVDVIEKHGVPKDPNGVEMVVGSAPRFGISVEERARRKQQKEAEKARLEAMSDDEKLAFAKQQREIRTEKKAAKKAAERKALIEQIKAEMAAGTVS